MISYPVRLKKRVQIFCFVMIFTSHAHAMHRAWPDGLHPVAPPPLDPPANLPLSAGAPADRGPFHAQEAGRMLGRPTASEPPAPPYNAPDLHLNMRREPDNFQLNPNLHLRIEAQHFSPIRPHLSPYQGAEIAFTPMVPQTPQFGFGFGLAHCFLAIQARHQNVLQRLNATANQIRTEIARVDASFNQPDLNESIRTELENLDTLLAQTRERLTHTRDAIIQETENDRTGIFDDLMDNIIADVERYHDHIEESLNRYGTWIGHTRREATERIEAQRVRPSLPRRSTVGLRLFQRAIERGRPERVEGIAIAETRQTEVNTQADRATEHLQTMTLQMEQAASEFIRDQIQYSRDTAETAVTLSQQGAERNIVEIVSRLALNTIQSVNAFLDGFNEGVYTGFVTAAQAVRAIAQNPLLIANLSNHIMHTLTQGPGAVMSGVTNGLRWAQDAVFHFELTIAFGSPGQRGHAFGELAANVLLGLAGGEAAPGARAVIENFVERIAASPAAELLGEQISQQIRATEAFIPQLADIERRVALEGVVQEAADSAASRIVEAARRQGIEVNFGENAGRVDRVLAETLGRTQREGGSFTSGHRLTHTEALEVGRRWVGEGYFERGTGTNRFFESTDGLRRFRIDDTSLLGTHEPYVPHVHLERLATPGARHPAVNNHIPFGD